MAHHRKQTTSAYSPHYASAVQSALVLHTVLGTLGLLMLDTGQMSRAFCVAWLCQWSLSFLILLRRPSLPSKVDLLLIRYGIVAVWPAVGTLGPWFLRSIGTSPEMIP